jgi:sporulation integral membrane protein YlbJ
MTWLKMRNFFHKISSGIAKIGLFLVFVLFALHSKEVIESARGGLDLCLYVVIPSLFPFFVLSQLFVKWRLCDNLGQYLTPLSYLLFRMRGVCFIPFLLGVTSGYPVGVRSILSLRKEGLCTETEANFMLTFCSNCGPAFLVGSVGTALFGSPTLGWVLYGSHVASALLCGVLFSFLPPFRKQPMIRPNPKIKKQEEIAILPSFLTAVGDSFSLILGVCAFIIFFCVVIGLLSAIGATSVLGELLGAYFPALSSQTATCLVAGFLEMTRGIQLASQLPGPLQPALCAALLCAFSGLSIHFQVLFLLKDSTLKKWPYFLGKTLHSLLATVLCAALLFYMDTAAVLPVFSPSPSFALPSLYGFCALLVALFVGVLLLPWVISFCFRH